MPARSAGANDDTALDAAPTIEGGRVRGIVLHKLMEELLTGELRAEAGEVGGRADFLCRQLATGAKSSQQHALDREELAGTALRTIALADLQPFRDSLVPEVSLFGTTADNPELVAGRADAISRAGNGDLVVFDWKSDVAPTERDRAGYRGQLGQYLRVLGAQRGAVVYMTSGRLDWIEGTR
jgi:CRISPR-associated exonuclease Cas4